MCGRVGLGKEQRYAIDQRYDFVLSRLDRQRRYNAPPSAMLPLVYDDAEGAHAVMAQWGLKPFWWKQGAPPSNARAETLREKPAFRNAFKSRRGFVVIDHFFEWQTVAPKVKQPWLFQRSDGEPMLMAALWEPGEPITTTIITTGANEWMAPIHNRMPFILEPHELKTWMDMSTSIDDVYALIQPGVEGLLKRVPVSKLVSTGVEDAAVCTAIVIEPESAS